MVCQLTLSLYRLEDIIVLLHAQTKNLVFLVFRILRGNIEESVTKKY